MSHHLRAFGLLVLVLGAAIPAKAETLRSQLEALAKENGILIEGLDRLGADAAKTAEGDPAHRIKAMLSDYNYLIVGEGGKIEKLTITSLKQVSPRTGLEGGVVKTHRLGTHHQVEATLSGPNNAEITTSLLVDTGATTLVLPESMIERLGLSRKSLQPGKSQTAAGMISVQMGVLKSVRVGEAIAENVPVSFIADKQLNGANLLGMSFLNRFRFSLDDANNELLLSPK